MGLNLKKDLRLQVGFVAAEMLPESLRSNLEDRFGMIIRQSYGTADIGLSRLRMQGEKRDAYPR